MSDPRFTDPRYSDQRLADPVLRRGESAGGMWGWIAGLAVLALIGFIVIAGWNSNSNTAANGPSPMTTTGSSSPMRGPPTTTGSGSASPMAPAPAQPAPSSTTK